MSSGSPSLTRGLGGGFIRSPGGQRENDGWGAPLGNPGWIGVSDSIVAEYGKGWVGTSTLHPIWGATVSKAIYWKPSGGGNINLGPFIYTAIGAPGVRGSFFQEEWYVTSTIPGATIAMPGCGENGWGDGIDAYGHGGALFNPAYYFLALGSVQNIYRSFTGPLGSDPIWMNGAGLAFSLGDFGGNCRMGIYLVSWSLTTHAACSPHGGGDYADDEASLAYASMPSFPALSLPIGYVTGLDTFHVDGWDAAEESVPPCYEAPWVTARSPNRLWIPEVGTTPAGNADNSDIIVGLPSWRHLVAFGDSGVVGSPGRYMPDLDPFAGLGDPTLLCAVTCTVTRLL